MKAISIRQPWASLIVTPKKNDNAVGIKNIENRTWKCPQKYIGQRVLIHASMAKSDHLIRRILNELQYAEFRQEVGYSGIDFLEPKGAIIGSVEIVGCVVNHPSIWAEKTINYEMRDETSGESEKGTATYNWILANPIKFDEPIPAKGKLSFWDFEY